MNAYGVKRRSLALRVRRVVQIFVLSLGLKFHGACGMYMVTNNLGKAWGIIVNDTCDQHGGGHGRADTSGADDLYL